MSYCEEIVKNSAKRQDYVDTIKDYLETERLKADERRKVFISPKSLRENVGKYREEYIKMLGFPLTEERKTPELSEKIFVAKDGDVNIYRLTFLFFGKVKFYAMYFEQVENPDKKPLVIGLHGGEGTPELISGLHLGSANYNRLVRRIADMGANVVVPQLLLWSKVTYGPDFNRERVDGKFRQLGGSVTAFELYLIRGTLDYFMENADFDKDKVGVAGLSYGGMYSLFLAALDERIKSCFSCSFVEDSFKNSWPDWSYKNAVNLFTTAEVCGLVAPRRLVVEMGDKDELFSSEITLKVAGVAADFYKEYNRESEFKCVIFEGVHETDKNDDGLSYFYSKLEA